MSELQTIKKRIIENITNYYPELSDGNVLLKTQKRLIRRNSIVYIFEIGGKETKDIYQIVAKILRKNKNGKPSREEIDVIQKEYQALTYLYPKMLEINRNYQFVRPLDFFPDINLLIIEKAKGKKLRNLLLKHNHPFAKPATKKILRNYILNCGKWLRTFHYITDTNESYIFKAEPYLSKVEEILNSILKFGFSKDFSSVLFRFLERISLLVDGRHKIKICAEYQNFEPQHIFVEGEKVTCYDPHFRKKDIIYRDINSFLVTLETLNISPRTPFYDQKFVKVLEEDFISGYFGQEKERDDFRETSFFLNLYKVESLLRRCRHNYRIARRYGKIPLFLISQLRIKNFYIKKIKDLLNIIEYQFSFIKR